MIQKNLVVISWSSLPTYAAYQIRSAIDYLSSYNIIIRVIATSPRNFRSDIESILDIVSVIWINQKSFYSWSSLGLSVPGVFFQSGWFCTAFNSLGREVKLNGGKVVCLADNSWKANFRQRLGALAFRYQYSKLFDAVWVPGNSASRLIKFYGVSSNKIYQGLYSADTDQFSSGISLDLRLKQFIFVGQIIKRKGIKILLKAFERFHNHFPRWDLKIIGTGSLDKIQEIPNVYWEGIQSSSSIARAMSQSRFLILPSYEDHWGVVVHEAACCGCGLILSDSVGASLDLLEEANGFSFKSGDVSSLYDALVFASQMNEYQLKSCFATSLKLASLFNKDKWSKTFLKILMDLDSTF